MRIASIELKNYRLFRHTKLAELPPAAIFVGANGSGKSTLFDALSFLKDALTHNVAHAVARRGGFRELVSRGGSGPISITLQFRGTGAPLEAYRVDVAQEDGRPVVQRELLVVAEESGDESATSHFLEMVRGKGKVLAKNVFDVMPERNIVLDDPSALAIKGLSQFREYRRAVELSAFLKSWHVSDFHIHDARPSAEAGVAEHLSASGENVAQVTQFLYEHHRSRFERILEVMRSRVPGVASVEAKPTEDGRLVLRFREGKFEDPFIARYVSDGTIKMFSYLVLLYDPKPHPLLAVEEPENQLYPGLLRELAEEFRDYARRGGQVLVSTHSPEFLNGAKLDEIYAAAQLPRSLASRRASTSSCRPASAPA